MSTEILSQDEVDALLKGVNGDEEVDPAPESTEGPKPYNLAKQERIVRGRMPALEIINERFARLLRVGLFNFMRRSAEISVGPVRVTKYGEFVRNLVQPSNLNIVQTKPLRGNSLIIFDPTLVFTVVDNMFGGDSRFNTRVEGRDFTPTEQRIIQRLLAVVLDGYNKAWQPVFPLAMEFLRSEMRTQFATIATPSEVVVSSTFSVELGSAGGAIHVVTPYSTLEPIREQIYSSAQSDGAEPDSRWMQMLRRQVQHAEVEISAHLARTPITLAQVLAMRRGDVIGMDIKPTLTAEVEGVPIFECRYGVLNGQYAIKVEKIIAVSQNENTPGDTHA